MRDNSKIKREVDSVHFIMRTKMFISVTGKGIKLMDKGFIITTTVIVMKEIFKMGLNKAVGNTTLQMVTSTKVLGMTTKEKERMENIISTRKVRNIKENSKKD